MAPNADVIGLVKNFNCEEFCPTSIFFLGLEFGKEDISHDGIVTLGPRICLHFRSLPIKHVNLGKLASL